MPRILGSTTRFVAPLVCAAALCAVPQAARASDAASSPETSTSRQIERDPVCEAALKAVGKTTSGCAAESVVRAGAAAVATPTMIGQDAALEAGDGTSLTAAALSGCTIYTRTWEQTKRGLYYVNWWETHKGRIYYDGGCGHVWSTTSTYGYVGYHKCGLGGGFGYTVEVRECFTERRYDLNGWPISEWDYFKVHVVYKGFPFAVTHDMHVNAYPTGDIYGH